MKKTALALALMMSAGVANAAAVSSLTVTYGDFGMEVPPDGPGGVNDWTGTITMDTTGTVTQVLNAFDFNGFLGQTDILSNGPLTGEVNAGVLTLDLSGWAIFWNGGNVGQGPADVNGPLTPTISYNDTTKVFTAEWSAYITGSPGGAFDTKTGNWIMTGTVNEVPVPAAVWLMGSGLLGLAGVARRRKAA